MPRWAQALVVAMVAALLVVATWAAFVLTAPGQEADTAVYGSALAGQVAGWRVVSAAKERLLLPLSALTVAGAAASALWQRRPGRAGVLLATFAGTLWSAQVLKRLVFFRPDMGLEPDVNTLPSGHTAVVAAAGISLVLGVPDRYRLATTAAASSFVAVVGAELVISQAHRPADVVAAILLALAWGAAGCAVLGYRLPRRVTTAGRAPVDRLVGVVAGVAGLLAIACAVAYPLGVPVVPPGMSGVLALSAGLLAIAAVSLASFAVLLRLVPPVRTGPGRALEARGTRTAAPSSAGSTVSR